VIRERSEKFRAEVLMELLEFTGNVALAMILGAIIGVERQFRQHPAGLRTNALVCIGAALFVSLTRLIGDTNSPTRIASYIVSGIGFLGGGVILKEGANIRGMTTAATLWCSAAVGTLAGAGFGLHAIIGVLAILLVVAGLRPIARWIDEKRKRSGGAEGAYQIRVECGAKDSLGVRTTLMRHVNGVPGLVVTGVTARKKKGRKRIVVTADIHADPANDKAIQEAVSRLIIEPGVLAARWEKVPPTVNE
jgi:putative Mg2+ transporter-C (MgtC) family protein